MPDTVLVLNSGSSSIKFQLFAVAGADELDRRLRGQFEGIGTKPRLVARDGRNAPLVDETYSEREVPDSAKPPHRPAQRATWRSMNTVCKYFPMERS